MSKNQSKRITKKPKDKPLTLNTFADYLAGYTHEVFIPALEERFVTKKEFKGLKLDVSGLKFEVKGLGGKVTSLENDFKKFKDESLTNQDSMLKKLDILLTEKEVREHQEKKEKQLWAIVLRALGKHKILSSKELGAIARLDLF